MKLYYQPSRRNEERISQTAAEAPNGRMTAPDGHEDTISKQFPLNWCGHASSTGRWNIAQGLPVGNRPRRLVALLLLLPDTHFSENGPQRTGRSSSFKKLIWPLSKAMVLFSFMWTRCLPLPAAAPGFARSSVCWHQDWCDAIALAQRRRRPTSQHLDRNHSLSTGKWSSRCRYLPTSSLLPVVICTSFTAGLIL